MKGEQRESISKQFADWLPRQTADESFRLKIHTSPKTDFSEKALVVFERETISKACSMPKRMRMRISYLNLKKKKLRLMITLLMFSLTIFLLMGVTLVRTYRYDKAAANYLSEQDIRKLYPGKTYSYDNEFFETIQNNISSGEVFRNEITEIYPELCLFPRYTVQDMKLEKDPFPIMESDLHLILADSSSAVNRSLAFGRFPEKKNEIAITDYLSYQFRITENDLGTVVDIDNVPCVVVGVTGTDYYDKEIVLKVKRGNLNSIETNDLDKEYKMILGIPEMLDYIKDNKKTLNLECSNFLFSDYKTMYLSSRLNYGNVSLLLDEKELSGNKRLIFGNMPKASDEILISEKLLLQSGEQIEEAVGSRVQFHDIFKQEYHHAYSNKLNLASQFPEGILITGVYSENALQEGVQPDVLLTDESFRNIKDLYFESYFQTGYEIELDMMQTDVFMERAFAHDINFDEPMIMKIQQYTGTINTLFPIIMLAFSCVVLLTVVMVGLYISNNIKANTKKIGIMKAIGVSTRNISQIFLTETIILTSISYVIGVLCSICLIVYVNKTFGTEIPDHAIQYMYLNVLSVVLAFILSLGIGMISSIMPLVKLARKKPIEIIRA